MKTIIIVRHGSDIFGRLSDCGDQQIRALAPKLKQFVEGKSARIHSSQEERAIKSAKILGEVLSVPLRLDGGLNTPTQYGFGAAEFYGKDIDTFIIVAHHDTCEYLPEEYAKRFQDTSWHGVLGNGEACVIDLDQKKVIRVE